KLSVNRSRRSVIRTATFLVVATAFFGAALLVGSNSASANHPVLVEGNCDSPVPGTTIVAPGTCGDFDGDGRIGTAEDTDGADRIFGTLNAALGPGTGAAAGTGANFNGKIIIVTSGRFAEALYIGQAGLIAGQPGGTANPSNVEIEAAPGVEANIDAILQGDPAGGNVTRTNQIGIFVVYPAGVTGLVSLRNLQIRNFSEGIAAALSSRVHIDHCRIENNLNYGIHAIDNTQISITNSQITATGRRTGVGASTTTAGDGLLVQGAAKARVSDSTFSHNTGNGIINSGIGTVNLFKVGSFFNGVDTAGNVTIAANPNFSN
ncbi:MAG TPA: right-handed parallel beta-helix repeat-containing protein, partial [Pyrinomonadaceae bacterium]|nr:right-handed parallel beta-helix repeat-containing protein [Pyrinomonadaceae bacterium]